MNKYAALVGTLKHEVYTYVASNEQKATHYYLRRERDGMGWDGRECRRIGHAVHGA